MEDNQPQPTAQNATEVTTVAPVAEASNEPASPASEPTTSAPAAEPTQPAEPSAEGTGEPAPQAVETTQSPEPERQPRPAERRINELLAQNKQLKEQLSPAPIPPVSPQVPKLSDQLNGKDYIDPTEIDQLGAKAYEQGVQTARGVNSLEVQALRQEMQMREAINETDAVAARLATEYKELNPSDATYNEALEKKIVGEYQSRAVRRGPDGRTFFDPSVKLADIAKEEVEFFRQATEFGKAQTSAALAKQADNATVPQSADAPAQKSFEQMTMAEKEAYLRAQGHDI